MKAVKDKRRPIDERVPDFRPPGSIFKGLCYYCGAPCRGIICGKVTCSELAGRKP